MQDGRARCGDGEAQREHSAPPTSATLAAPKVAAPWRPGWRLACLRGMVKPSLKSPKDRAERGVTTPATVIRKSCGLSAAEVTLLKVFDKQQEYGPAVGVSRLSRWERAKMFGREPPIEVLHILQRLEACSSEHHCHLDRYF